MSPVKRMPDGDVKPVVTVVTVHGIATVGVTTETDPEVLALRILAPLYAAASAPSPRLLATVVTEPMPPAGSIM